MNAPLLISLFGVLLIVGYLILIYLLPHTLNNVLKSSQNRLCKIWLPVCLFLSVLIIYFLTGARTYSWANFGNDGGDLAAAVARGSLAHPPGFPLYMILAQIAAAIIPLPDLAWRMVVLSAIGGSLSSLFIYLSLVRVTKQHFAAIIGAVSYAFAVLPWSQATIVEVSTWISAAVAVAGYWCIRAVEVKQTNNDVEYKNSQKYLLYSCLAIGLGLTIHPIAAVAAPVLLVFMIRFHLLPKKMSGWIKLIIAGIFPLLLYLTLFLRFVWHPTYDWVNLSDFKQLYFYISASGYWHVLQDMHLVHFLNAPLHYGVNVARNLFLFNAILSIIGLIVAKRTRMLTLTAVAIICAAIPVVVHAVNPVLGGYYTVTMLPWAFLVGVGAAAIIKWLINNNRFYLIGFLLIAPLSLLILNWSIVDVSQDRAAQNLWQRVFSFVPSDSMLIVVDGAVEPRARDGVLFALMYGAASGQAKANVAVIGVSRLTVFNELPNQTFPTNFNWSMFKDNSIVFDEQLRRFIEQNKERDPIYFIFGPGSGFKNNIIFGPLLLHQVASDILYEFDSFITSTTPHAFIIK